MQLVVDTNVIIAALFKNAITRELLWEENFEFFAPEHIRVELEKLVKNPKFMKRLHIRDKRYRIKKFDRLNIQKYHSIT